VPAAGVVPLVRGGWELAGVVPLVRGGWELAGAVPQPPRRAATAASPAAARTGSDRARRSLIRIYQPPKRRSLGNLRCPACPEKRLAGFAAVDAGPGETVNVGILLPERAFQHWADGWTLEAGTFGLAAGSSSASLPLSASVTLK
jgi:beta-glucosidase